MQTDLGASLFPTIVADNINVNGVEKLWLACKAIVPKVQMACILAHLLKESAHNMAPSLTHIYKATFHQCRLPCDWKTALVFPIYKKGSSRNPTNYGPICLTLIPCKVLEHPIYASLYNHLETNSILSDAQHGFNLLRLNLSSLLMSWPLALI